MTREKEAAAIRRIAEGLYMYADALFESGPARPETEAAGAVSPPAMPPAAPAFEESPFLPDEFQQPSLADESVEFADQGSEAVCPKHRVPYTAGTYGPYCKQTTDDPAWGKQKGDTLWCRITPKNAAEYLRIKAAA
jgi:hypothetical protein